MRNKKRSARNKLHFAKKLILFAAILLVLYSADVKIRPIITTVAGNRVKNIAAKAINLSVLDEFVDNGITYDQLIKIDRTETNTVASISANTVLMNQIKSKLINLVLLNIASCDTEDLMIPVGTLSGIQFFSGLGPSIMIKVLPSSMIDAYFVSELTSAGINQALHRISIHFSIEVSAVIPGYTTKVTVETDVLVAETVIVGMTPESYTQVEGEDGSILSKINDYGQ